MTKNKVLTRPSRVVLSAFRERGGTNPDNDANNEDGPFQKRGKLLSTGTKKGRRYISRKCPVRNAEVGGPVSWKGWVKAPGPSVEAELGWVSGMAALQHTSQKTATLHRSAQW